MFATSASPRAEAVAAAAAVVGAVAAAMVVKAKPRTRREREQVAAIHYGHCEWHHARAPATLSAGLGNPIQEGN